MASDEEGVGEVRCWWRSEKVVMNELKAKQGQREARRLQGDDR